MSNIEIYLNEIFCVFYSVYIRFSTVSLSLVISILVKDLLIIPIVQSS